MCGLWGVISTSLNDLEIENALNLGYLSVFRGGHSTGIAVAGRRKKGKTNFAVHKDVGPSWDFLWRPDTTEFLKVNRPYALMGHCRYATSGMVNRHNAHPMQEKHIIGMHNGTIQDFQPPKAEEEVCTDSRILYRKVSDQGLVATLKETGEYGAYAMTWLNAQNMTFNMIRNDKRPLWIMKNGAGNTHYWASEKMFLDFVASRANSGWFQEPFELAVHTVLQWKLGDTQPVREKLDVEPPKKVWTNYSCSEWWRNHKHDWCHTCHKREDYCQCKDEPVTIDALFHEVKEEITELRPLLPVLPAMDLRPYKGYGGVLTNVQSVLKHMVCFGCQKQKAATDRLWWLSKEDCVCNDCLRDDPIIKANLAPNESNLWEGRIINA